MDTYRHFLDALSREVRESLSNLVRESGEELLVARSEDARNRIVDTFIRDVQAGRAQKKKERY